MNIDKNTYGKNPAEIQLSIVLNKINNKNLTHHVGNKLAKVSHVVKTFKQAPKNEYVNTHDFLYKLLKNHFFNEIENTEIVKKHPEVESYFKNSVVIRLKALSKD